jgi:hypothetical protein
MHVSSSKSLLLDDKGGRRLGIERRQFSYDQHIPERRSGQERRRGKGRRSGLDRRKGLERRRVSGAKIRGERRNVLARRTDKDRRSASAKKMVV